jgi:hypothetical protein
MGWRTLFIQMTSRHAFKSDSGTKENTNTTYAKRSGAPATSIDSSRGMKNYWAIMNGEKSRQQLTPAELTEVLEIFTRLNPGGGSTSGNNDGISLRDIERKCEVYKYSENYGDLECRGSDLRIIERKCEVYFYDARNGEIECSGSDFRSVERNCSVYMYSENYGEIDC